MQTDESLALAIQQGDKNALIELVNRHHSRLIGYLYRICDGDRGLAEDMTQETFLRTIRSIQQYEYPRRFKTWLYTIATNIMRDHYKRAEMRYTILSIDRSESINSHSELTPEDTFLGDVEISHVIKALQQLSKLHQSVILLRYYEELPLKDIADILDIPVGTVKSRLSLGLKHLKKHLEQNDIYES